MFHVYILYSKSYNRYYTGHTADIESRLAHHNGGNTKSTKAYLPWELVYIESFTTRSDAQTREYAIKAKKSRKYIEWLISSVG